MLPLESAEHGVVYVLANDVLALNASNVLHASSEKILDFRGAGIEEKDFGHVSCAPENEPLVLK